MNDEIENEIEPIKRGPGRPPKPSVPNAGTATLIYHPGKGDPPEVEWDGITFLANVPKALPIATRGDGPHSMIELAKGNPHFSVDGKRYKRVAPNREPVPPAGADVDPVALDDHKMVEVD